MSETEPASGVEFEADLQSFLALESGLQEIMGKVCSYHLAYRTESKALQSVCQSALAATKVCVAATRRERSSSFLYVQINFYII